MQHPVAKLLALIFLVFALAFGLETFGSFATHILGWDVHGVTLWPNLWPLALVPLVLTFGFFLTMVWVTSAAIWRWAVRHGPKSSARQEG
jgi:hypothetical protein